MTFYKTQSCQISENHTIDMLFLIVSGINFLFLSFVFNPKNYKRQFQKFFYKWRPQSQMQQLTSKQVRTRLRYLRTNLVAFREKPGPPVQRKFSHTPFTIFRNRQWRRCPTAYCNSRKHLDKLANLRSCGSPFGRPHVTDRVSRQCRQLSTRSQKSCKEQERYEFLDSRSFTGSYRFVWRAKLKTASTYYAQTWQTTKWGKYLKSPLSVSGVRKLNLWVTRTC